MRRSRDIEISPSCGNAARSGLQLPSARETLNPAYTPHAIGARCGGWLGDSRDAAQLVPSSPMIRLGYLRLEAKPQIGLDRTKPEILGREVGVMVFGGFGEEQDAATHLISQTAAPVLRS